MSAEEANQAQKNNGSTVLPRPELVVIDDDEVAIEAIRCAAEPKRIVVVGFTSPIRGLEYVQTNRPELVLLDLNMPELNGLEVLDRIVRVSPATDVILTTADYSTESAVRAIQLGASDYWTKPLNVERLQDQLELWLDDQQARSRRLTLDAELARAYDFQGIVGRSPALMDMFTKVRRLAPHFQTVLVHGETGTGKELVANALHKLSPRASRPLVLCNCAALVDTLVESELFGYVKGAFTGAADDRPGLIEAAESGTLFLDEVGEIPLATQAKLLRVLQNRELRRVGASRSRTVDVHVIAATNRDLLRMVEQGAFREDLYYRLAIVEIRVPSLSERKEDLPLLIRHFLDKCATQCNKPGLSLTRRAEMVLRRYAWPGNIRELENMLASCAMVADGNLIDIADIPERIRHQNPSWPCQEGLVSLADMERSYVRYVLGKVGNNMTKAAETLGIARTTLYRLLQYKETVHGDDCSKPASNLAVPTRTAP